MASGSLTFAVCAHSEPELATKKIKKIRSVRRVASATNSRITAKITISNSLHLVKSPLLLH